MPAPDVISLGCRLNAYEGEVIRRVASAEGVENAVVINSCAVTNEAVRQTRQAIRRARRMHPEARIVVTGCAAQIDPAQFASMSEVDAVLGNAEKLDARNWRGLANSSRRVAVNDIMAVRDGAHHMVDGYGDRSRAFLHVQNGCDHRCTFCIIPFGRGPSRSVSIEESCEAARRLVDFGHAEIVLTGVDITSWGGDIEGRPRLGALVGAILRAVPNLFRLRLSSIDGAEVDEELFDLLCGEPRVAPYLHISLQSGDNLILKRMKRRHSREDAIKLSEALRRHRPEIAFGADLIAGFPTETDEMFENSIAIISDLGLSYVHVFPFSPREGTPAARMPQVDRRIVFERAERLRDRAEEARKAFLSSLVGVQELAVIESGSRARLGNFATVRLPVSADTAPGSIARIQVTEFDGRELSGALV